MVDMIIALFIHDLLIVLVVVGWGLYRAATWHLR